LVFTGKGGVGKTTSAAATAIAIAAARKRVLIASSDPAHSLGDCLDVRLSAEPSLVSDSLYAMEIDARHEMRTRFGEVRDTMMVNMQESGLDPTLAAEMIEFPGAEELFAMLRVSEIRGDRSFDCVVLDTAPTGNTLRFLNFPEFLSPIQRALRLERAYNRLTAPFARLAGRHATADSYYDTIFRTFGDIERARQGFLDDDTRFRIVLNPERLAIVEAQRAVSFLNVAGFFIDAMIVNRILSQSVSDPFFAQWKQLHRQYVSDIYAQFHPITVLEAPLRDREVVGLEHLTSFAAQLYGEREADAVLSEDRPFKVEKVNGRFQLRIRIPSLDRSELALDSTAEGLHVRIGPYERKIPLPSALAGADVTGARYDERYLTIDFGAV
jgi:arsenite-transporting ATPase